MRDKKLTWNKTVWRGDTAPAKANLQASKAGNFSTACISKGPPAPLDAELVERATVGLAPAEPEDNANLCACIISAASGLSICKDVAWPHVSATEGHRDF